MFFVSTVSYTSAVLVLAVDERVAKVIPLEQTMSLCPTFRALKNGMKISMNDIVYTAIMLCRHSA